MGLHSLSHIGTESSREISALDDNLIVVTAPPKQYVLATSDDQSITLIETGIEVGKNCDSAMELVAVPIHKK